MGFNSRFKGLMPVPKFVKIHKQKSNKMEECIKILLFHIIWNSTCFGRHTAHYQDPKTALAASGFFIRGRLLDV